MLACMASTAISWLPIVLGVRVITSATLSCMMSRPSEPHCRAKGEASKHFAGWQGSAGDAGVMACVWLSSVDGSACCPLQCTHNKNFGNCSTNPHLLQRAAQVSVCEDAGQVELGICYKHTTAAARVRKEE